MPAMQLSNTGVRAESPPCPTVLEQDYFYSILLCSHATVQTNSHTRDDDRTRLFSFVKSCGHVFDVRFR